MISEHTHHYWFKRFLPTSLFGRAFLILVLPMLIMQASVIYFFYDQHWENVQRHLSLSLAGDVAFLVHEMQQGNAEHRHEVETLARDMLHIDIRKETNDDPDFKHFPSTTDDDIFVPFVEALREKIDEPFLIRRARGDTRVLLGIKIKDGVLRLQFSIKRLANVTTELFIWWMIGSAALVLFIATVFLRNQIRPIRKLAEAAESFGKGQDIIDFRPQGANEVRQAGRSFLAMRERLKRMINARTEMLAAISHDLRTPLTRMRLELAMLPDQKYAKPVIADVHDMERMIQEYLDFARGEGGEKTQIVRLSALLGSVVSKYERQGKDITLALKSNPEVSVLHNAMCRCLYNVIDNALRYGSRCEINAEEMAHYVVITIDDNGPGIPAEQRELAMQPFKRLDTARNLDTSGAGLGLSIVQDIVLRHGGEVTLEDSHLGGLRVKMRLPL